MEAIVISGKPATGKTLLANILSKRLKIPLTSGSEILKEMAIEKGYKPGGDDWWDTPEGMKFLKEREGNKEFDRETDRRLAQKIAAGNIVMTSWTAPWIIKEGFKVWLSASDHTRAERMSARDHINLKQSESILAKRDADNRKIYMELYGIDIWGDTSPFNLIIDTDSRTPEQVADVVVDAIKKRK